MLLFGPCKEFADKVRVGNLGLFSNDDDLDGFCPLLTDRRPLLLLEDDLLRDLDLEEDRLGDLLARCLADKSLEASRWGK